MSWRERWLGQRPRKTTAAPPRPLDSRVLVGVPDVFTGGDTTYGTVRKMTEDIRDKHWETAAEQGMAITILAIISDLEQVLYPEGDGGD